MSTADFNSLVQAASEIAAERAQQIGKLRDALNEGDDKKALALARELCGLYDEPVQKPNEGVN